MIKGDASRETLQNLLLSYFEEITSNKAIYTNIKNELTDGKKHDMPSTKVDGIFTQTTPINSITDAELYLIDKYTYEYFKDGDNRVTKLNPKDYFLPNEILVYEEFKYPRVTNTSNVVEFKNVIKVNQNQYLCISPSHEVAEIFNRGLFYYDPQTQRQLIKALVNKKIVKKPTIINQKIKAIEESLETGKLNDYSITLNIPVTGEEKFEEKGNNIRIQVDGVTSKIACIDGFHRLVAISNFANANPTINFNIVLKIYHVTTAQAAVYVSSVDMQTKMEDLHVQTISNSDPYINMVKDINSYGNKETNPLFNKLGEDMFDVENQDKYTTYGILAKAIENYFDKDKELSMFERIELQNYLIKGFMYIIGVNEKEFKDIKNSRKDSYVTNPNTFIGYISMLAELYKKDDWSELLMSGLRKMDFSKEAKPVLQNMGLFYSKLNAGHYKKIAEHFTKYIRKEVV